MSEAKRLNRFLEILGSNIEGMTPGKTRRQLKKLFSDVFIQAKALSDELDEMKEYNRQLVSQVNEEDEEVEELKRRLQFEESIRRDYDKNETKELAKRLFVSRKIYQNTSDPDSVGNISLLAIQHASRFVATWNEYRESEDAFAFSFKNTGDVPEFEDEDG